MGENDLYSYVLKGELTKVALNNTGIISKHSTSDILIAEYINCLSLDLLDDECVVKAKEMATVYVAISSFENMVRKFIVKILLEYKGEDWWNISVPDKIKKTAEVRKNEEEKIKWHAQRGTSMINYVDFGDLASIMQQNLELFEIHII